MGLCCSEWDVWFVKGRFNQRRSKDEWHCQCCNFVSISVSNGEEKKGRPGDKNDGGINSEGRWEVRRGGVKEKSSEMCEAAMVKTPEKSWPTLRVECRAAAIDVNAAPADIAEVSLSVRHTAITHSYPAFWLLLKQKHITASLVGLMLTKACTEVSKNEFFHNGTLLWTPMHAAGFANDFHSVSTTALRKSLGIQSWHALLAVSQPSDVRDESSTPTCLLKTMTKPEIDPGRTDGANWGTSAASL